MNVATYATSHGPHQAATYALMAVDQIIQVEQTAAPDLMAAGLMLKAQLLTAFTPIFQDCIDAELQALTVSSDRLNEHMDPMPFMDRAYLALLAAGESSPFAEHFAKEEVRLVHAQTLANHFGTCIHVERSWWADENPDDEQSAIFKARFHG